MALVPYTNTAQTNLHIGGKTILPGETREVDETQIPGFGQPLGEDNADTLEEMQPNPLAIVLEGNVKDVEAAIDALSAEQLDELEYLETEAEKPRKGVLEAIDKRRLELAQEVAE